MMKLITTSKHTMDNKENTGSSNPLGTVIQVRFAQAEQPKFIEKKGTYPYVEYGEKNNYPDYLLSLFDESPKHGAIVKGKANYIFGKGFDGIKNPANTTGESWNDIAKKCILDDEIFSGYYFQVIYNLLGKVKDVFHLEFYKVRTNKAKSVFYVKDDWSDTKEKIRTYPAFDNKYDKEHVTKILYVPQYSPKSRAYPQPNYFQALNYIESDVQIGRHILGNAKEGFSVTKMVQFFNGEPTEEQKGDVKKRIKAISEGSEGDRYWIVFNRSKDSEVSVNDLGSTMLTKEDFTNINNLVQQEIFAGHQVTSPMLFGIKTEGQLGGRSEIRDAYEIFNNTYVNERQQAHEAVFNMLLNLTGNTGTYKITPVEPLGFTLEDSMLLQVMPREYFLDKLAVDQKYYSLPPVTGEMPVAPVPTTDPSGQPIAAVNDNLKNMTGKQFQQLDRIKKRYISGKMTRTEAAMMLKNSFGLSDEDIAVLLDNDSSSQQFDSHDEIDFALVEQFAQVGEDRNMFEVLASKPAREVEYFADVKQLNQLEANVLNLIKKDKRVTAEVIAKALKAESAVISKVISGLTDAGIIAAVTVQVGEDQVIERTATGTKVAGEQPTTTEILLRYSYDGPQDDKNRPFCAKLMAIDRLYSRADIENISMRLGYSVWDRRGGWFTLPNGEHRPYCRHQWNALTVIRKKP